MPTATEVKLDKPEAADAGHPLLEARIRKSFISEQEFTLDVELNAAPGFTILFGPSGSGKTTLLDCIAGLTTPEAGRVVIGGRVFFDKGLQVDQPISRRAVGYVLQELALFPHMTVAQNAEYGLVQLPRAERRRRAEKMLREFGIDHLRQQYPARISGGERQRVALARVLVTDPGVLLLDEPLAALDVATKAKIIDDLRRWNQAHGIPILYVTHSREEVIALGERVLVLEQGRIIAQGTPHEVLRAPLQETVAQLAGFENIFDATVESVHEERGSMICRVVRGETNNSPEDETGKGIALETPLVRAEPGSRLRIGIRAGDILLAIAEPAGLSARNLIPGRIVSMERRDMIVSARVDCGVEVEVYLTLAACHALQLESGRNVWLVIKTHSCHLMRE